MIAIVVSEDQHLQQTISSLLQQIGYPKVLVTNNVDEADYYFIKEQKNIKLVLFDSSPNQGIDNPLARLIIQKESLNLTSLIHISNHSGNTIQSNNSQDPLSRIDTNIIKPFGIRQLKTAILKAQRRRAKQRSKILVIGNKYNNTAIEAMYKSAETVHWKKIIFVNSLDEFKKNILEFQFRIGSILIESEMQSPEIISELNQFKKTTLGSVTPLVLLSNHPDETIKFRDFADLYLDPEETNWESILNTISNRLVLHADMIDAVLEAKKYIKSHQPKKARKIIDHALKLDSNRWEVLEVSGRIHELLGNKTKSIRDDKNSLLTNPCNPGIYLHLHELLKDSEKNEIIKSGKSFCPFHPQIIALNHHE